MRRSVGIVLLVLVVVGLVVAIALVSGEGGPPASDRPNDVSVENRAGAPENEALTDIVDARVTRTEGDVEFTAQMFDPVPREFDNAALEWRWEIHEGGKMTWILIATVDVEPNASLISTRNDLARSTVDDTLPGVVEVFDNEMVVRFDPDRVRDFPSEFRWHLIASLDGDREDARSALAYDHAPDRGTRGFSAE